MRPGGGRRAAVLLVAIQLFRGPGPRAAEEPRDAGLQEKVAVRLVQMPILATDRQGRGIADLKAEEIVVEHRGQKLKVAYLESAKAVEEREALDARLYVEAPGGFDVPVSSTGLRSSYVILFIDVDNDDTLRKDAAVESMLAFLQGTLEPGTRVAVVSFDGEVHLELTFTDDRSAIAGALRQAWARHAQGRLDLRGQVRQFLGLLDQCMLTTDQFDRATADESCVEQRSMEYAEQLRPRAEAFLTALAQTVRVAGGLRGPKSIIAVSHGIAADSSTEILEAVRSVYGPDAITNLRVYLGFGGGPKAKLDELLGLALRNKVTLHFVDRTRAPSADIDASKGHPLQPGSRPLETAYTAAQEDLKEIAGSTGGVFVPSPDLAKGLASVRAAQAGSYELGFYVGDDIPSTSLVKIEVDATRKGVRIAHRRGFFGSSPAEDLAVKGTIVLGPPSARSEPGHAGARHSFKLLVDPRTIGYARAGSDYGVNFTLHFVVRTFHGRDVVDSFHFVNHAYPADVWNAGKMKPILVNGWTELPPGAFTLEAWIRNTDTGREGRVMTALEVEDGEDVNAP